MTEIALRPPRPDEAAALTELSLRSKAVWGYDAAFMAACVAGLTVTPAMLDPETWRVAEMEGKAVGLVEVSPSPPEAELERIFVDPALAGAGTGLGRRLFDWAAEQARAAGARRMLVAADPQARGFYERMGMQVVGEIASGSIEGRFLPRLALDLEAAEAG